MKGVKITVNNNIVETKRMKNNSILVIYHIRGGNNYFTLLDSPVKLLILNENEDNPSKIVKYVEFTNSLILSKLPAYPVTKKFTDKGIGCKVSANLIYNPEKDVCKIVSFSIELYDLGIKHNNKPLWFYSIIDYGINPKTKLSVIFNKKILRYPKLITLLLHTIKLNYDNHKTFEKIIELEAKARKITSGDAVKFKRFTCFVMGLVEKIAQSVKSGDLKVVGKQVSIDFLPDGKVAIGGCDGSIMGIYDDIGILPLGSISVMPEVTQYDYIRLFVANLQNSELNKLVNC